MKINHEINNLSGSVETLERKIFEQTSPKVISTIKDLLAGGPYRFWGTLTFQYELDEPKAKSELKKFWRKVQREVLKANWIEKGRPQMTGIAILEHAFIFPHSRRRSGSCHFHFLLHDNPHFARNNARAEQQLTKAFQNAAAKLTHKNKRWQLTSRHGTGVAKVWNAKGICGYVAKEARHWWWEWDKQILFLCKDGAI